MSPKRLCIAFGPGCDNAGIAVAGTSRCPAHSKKWRKTPQMQARSGHYNTPRWRRLRAQVLAEEPVCRVCGVNPSTQADHIIGFGEPGGAALFYERANVRGICGPCHTRRTASQGGKAAKAKRRQGT